jgi:TIR domain
MLKREWDLLFSEYDLRAVLENQLGKVNDAVIALPRDRFAAESAEFLAASVASGLVISPIQIHESEIEVETVDTKVDVSHDFDRAVWDRSAAAYVDGVEVTYHLPFSGEPELLKCQPSSYTMNPPRAVIGSGELTFPYDSADRNISNTKRLFNDDLQELKRWIPWVNDQVNGFNSTLETQVRQRVTGRRAELDREKEQVASLGFKVRGARSTPEPPQTLEARQARRQKSREKLSREYDVALSFAGEDRQYVEKVAEGLRAAGVSVFYDGFERAALWGKDLAEHLGEVYGKNSRFVVMFLSRAYAAKAWPNHEKQFAIGRQLASGERRILPARFDDTEIAGIASTIGYLDLRVLTPEKLVELIRQKVDSEDAEA